MIYGLDHEPNEAVPSIAGIAGPRVLRPLQNLPLPLRCSCGLRLCDLSRSTDDCKRASVAMAEELLYSLRLRTSCASSHHALQESHTCEAVRVPDTCSGKCQPV